MILAAMNLFEALPYILGSGVVTAIITVIATRKKTVAEAGLSDANSAKFLVDTATELTKQYREENVKNQQALSEAYTEISEMREHISQYDQKLQEVQEHLAERSRALVECQKKNDELQGRLDDISAPHRRRQNPNS